MSLTEPYDNFINELINTKTKIDDLIDSIARMRDLASEITVLNDMKGFQNIIDNINAVTPYISGNTDSFNKVCEVCKNHITSRGLNNLDEQIKQKKQEIKDIRLPTRFGLSNHIISTSLLSAFEDVLAAADK